MRRFPQLVVQRLFYSSTIVLFLLLCLYWYRSSYFYYDDFNCMFLAQQQSLLSIVGHNLNPFSEYFRPLYMLAYWVHWNLFGLSPLPYHVFMWALHGLNVFLLFALLKRFSGSEYGAAIGSLLFAYQIAFREIFFNFACLGELQSACLMMAGILAYDRWSYSNRGLIGCYGIFFFALKAKEMAVTLPAIWLLYELTVRTRLVFRLLPGSDHCSFQETLAALKEVALRLALPFLMAAGYLLLKVPVMGGLIPYAMATVSHPYHVDYSPTALLVSYSWYFNSLFRSELSPLLWLGICLLLLAFFLWRRCKNALFFLLYIFVTFGPIIVLVNRRLPYYWYIPSVGLGGLIALTVKPLVALTTRILSPRVAALAGAVFFLTVGYYHYSLQKEWTRPMMTWVYELTEENRHFIAGLQALPPPGPNEIVCFQSVPQYFDEIGANSVAQVVFRRTDISGRIVPQCPRWSRYCVLFQNPRVSLVKNHSLVVGNGSEASHSSTF